MLESRRGERSRLAGFAVERHFSQEAVMAPNILTVRLDCSGLQHKRFVHFGVVRGSFPDACRKFRPNREVATAEIATQRKAHQMDESLVLKT